MIRHFCLSGGSDFAILTLSYPYNFTEFLRKLGRTGKEVGGIWMRRERIWDRSW